MTTLEEAKRLDADPGFPSLRDRFDLPADRIYLDGNSLGALPTATAGRLADLVRDEWGRDLIGSWNRHDWIGAPGRAGAAIAPLIGAHDDEVVVSDTTSVNLFKLLAAACMARPGRHVILSEPGNFPTDLYMADGVARMLDGVVVRTVPTEQLIAAIDDDVACVLLTHVHYRSGRRHDMRAITAAAHEHGALVLWDLSHSVGAIRVDLNGCDADLAVGCGYKYLNGGPGAPAFLYVARRLHADLASPLSGWMGHAEPFGFDDRYRPADGIGRFLCGTPSILATAALEEGLALFREVDLDALFARGQALCDYYIALMAERCDTFGFGLITPRSSAERGSHVSYTHDHAYPICQALIARGVIGDFRAPDVLRMGFTPLYTRFEDVWRAVDILADVMATGAWNRPAFHERGRVT